MLPKLTSHLKPMQAYSYYTCQFKGVGMAKNILVGETGLSLRERLRERVSGRERLTPLRVILDCFRGNS